MIQIKTAEIEDIQNIARLRALQQIEDWENTDSEKHFSQYRREFIALTAEYLRKQLNKSIYFAVMYDENEAVAICAIEETKGLPQITACSGNNTRSGSIVSVFTLPEMRSRGFAQRLIKYIIDFAYSKGFCELTLSTNTSAAKHIYEKAGFKYISDKYYLSLLQDCSR